MKNKIITPLCTLLSVVLAGSVSLAGAAGASPLPAKKAAPHAKKASLKPKAPVGISRTADYFTAVPFPGFAPPMPVSPVDAPEAAQSDAFCRSGAAQAAKGDWAGASSDYAQALALWPDSKEALYGAARSAAGMGDVPSALGYYRAAIYTSAPFPYARRLREPYAFRSMPFALLLNEAGQAAEAVSVYDEVADQLNHEGDQEHALIVDLPEFGGNPGQAPYTPQALEAMAHLAIGITVPGYDVPQMRQALALAPDSAGANFYLGRYLAVRNDPSGKALLEKVAQFGDYRTAKAVNDLLQVLF